MARYPGEKFQPYVGAGIGIFWANIHSSLQNLTATSPGANVIAGSRFFVTKQVALFGEYKFNHATFDFDLGGGGGVSTTYNAHILAGGVTYHFRKRAVVALLGRPLIARGRQSPAAPRL